MEIKKIARRNFIKYGLVSSFFLLSGCSIPNKKFALRGFLNTFPSEFIDSLPSSWEFVPIKNTESNTFPYNSTFQEKTDLLVLNDGWISDLPHDSLQEIKATNIRNNFSTQTSSFLDGLGEYYKHRILPFTVSPWVILFRNEESLALKNKDSWEVIFSNSLEQKIILPNSPSLIISIAQKTGFLNDLSKLKSQAKSFDDRNALNWVISGKANAAILPLSRCVDSLIKDPRLSVILPERGSPLNWTVIASPIKSKESFPEEWFDLLWSQNYSGNLIRKGFLPPTSFSNLSRKKINMAQRYKSIFLPEEKVWNRCWSLPLLSSNDKKDLAFKWNNS